jgi:hypothetical protein
MTGYTMPLAEEINPGLNTLGKSVNDNWAVTVAALNDPSGGLTPANLSPDPSGTGDRVFPKDVLLDPPSAISNIFSQLFKAGAPAVGGELPSEFKRPWRWPAQDNQGDTVNAEWPLSVSGPYLAPADATVLFAGAPGDPAARGKFETSASEAATNDLARSLLRQGKHLGDPQDYAAYVIATLTRNGLDPAKAVNFNLDADRGYAYLCWDWVRDKGRPAMPKQAFAGNPDPGNANTPDNVSQHVYSVPILPGYGWNSDDQIMGPGVTPVTPFNPGIPSEGVRIRYIGRERKFI